MRILWVKMNGLWPATTGGRVRSLQIVSALAAKHQVTVLTTHGAGDDPEGLKARLSHCERVVSFPYQPAKKGTAAFYGAVARSWFSRHPVDLRKWRLPEMRERVDALMADGSVDVCVSDFLFAAMNVPFDSPIPVVLFEHNVEYMIWQRLAAIERRPLHRAILEVEWRKLRARESDFCAWADQTIAVSEEDRRRLADLAPNASTSSIPTGVDTEYFAPMGTPEKSGRLVFSGSMDWQPNEDAVLYFIDAILPRIRKDMPDASFSIVGRNPSARVRAAAARPGIFVSGTVDDVRPWLDEGSVYVVPLRAGGGTRLKIFEALAMAKPVVSTTVGAEGLAVVPDEHYVAADEPADFARAVVALLRDPARRQALGSAGRRLVEEHFSWSTIAREFEQQCEEAVIEHAGALGAPGRRPHLPRGGSARPPRIGVLAGEYDAAGRAHRHP